MRTPLRHPIQRAACHLADAVANRVAARLKTDLAALAQGTADPPKDPTHIVLDYPVRPRSRYGHGRPTHPEMAALLARGRDRYREQLNQIMAYSEQLSRIPAHPGSTPEPAWINGYIPGLDGAALYAFVADRAPAMYFEVGSGNSTRFGRRAIRDAGLRTRIVSVDPAPRADIDGVSDEVIRTPLEDANLGVLDQLRPGDVVFVDNSHRVLQNSDATVVFLELLPRLPAGVLVGLHDIFLPDDYPDEWNDRYYSEQYALATFLLGGHAGFLIELPAFYVSRHDPELAAITAPLWEAPGLSDVEPHGGAFWMSTEEQ